MFAGYSCPPPGKSAGLVVAGPGQSLDLGQSRVDQAYLAIRCQRRQPIHGDGGGEECCFPVMLHFCRATSHRVVMSMRDPHNQPFLLL